MTDLSGLFQPVRIGGLTLPNRIVFPAMGLSICADGVPGKQAAAYYARRATGGAGLVMTEGVYIDHPSSAAFTATLRWPPGDGWPMRCTPPVGSACPSCGMSGSSIPART